MNADDGGEDERENQRANGSESEDRAPESRDERATVDDPGAARERMRAALAAVRWEHRKVVAIYATLDAVLAALAADVAWRVVEPAGLPRRLPLPAAAAEAGVPAPDTATVVAVLAAVAVAGIEVAVRLRRPAIERFEAVNPPVAEALRTARDAVDDDAASPMAARLYDDTITRLGEASSFGLLNVRRIAATLVLVALLAPGAVYVTAADIDLEVSGPEPPTTGPTRSSETEYEGLQNPDQVLGDPENVSAGDRSVDTTLPTRGAGGGNRSAAAYDATGYGDADIEVESQQAGFEEQARIEDAELIREYNLRIRSEEAET